MEIFDALEATVSPEGFQFDCRAPSPRASSPATPRLFGDPLINLGFKKDGPVPLLSTGEGELSGTAKIRPPVRGLQSSPPGSGGGQKSRLKNLFSAPDAASSQGRSAVKVPKNSKTPPLPYYVNRVFGCISHDPVLDSIRRGFDRSSSHRRGN